MVKAESDDELIAHADERGFWVCKHCFYWTLREALVQSGQQALEGPAGVRVEVAQIARLRGRLGIT